MDEGEIALRNRFTAGTKKGLGSSFYPLMSLNMSFRRTGMLAASTQAVKKDEKSKNKE